jgi:hypothetical protein
VGRLVKRYEFDAWVQRLIGAEGRELSHQASRTLTDAQIKSLPTTEIEIVPEAPAGSVLVFMGGVGVLDASAGAYACTSAGFLLAQDSQEIYNSGFVRSTLILTQTIRSIFYFRPTSEIGDGDFSGLNVTNPSQLVSAAEPITLRDYFNGSDFTGGHAANTFALGVEFRVFSLALARFLSVRESGWNQEARTFA